MPSSICVRNPPTPALSQLFPYEDSTFPPPASAPLPLSHRGSLSLNRQGSHSCDVSQPQPQCVTLQQHPADNHRPPSPPMAAPPDHVSPVRGLTLEERAARRRRTAVPGGTLEERAAARRLKVILPAPAMDPGPSQPRRTLEERAAARGINLPATLTEPDFSQRPRTLEERAAARRVLAGTTIVPPVSSHIPRTLEERAAARKAPPLARPSHLPTMSPPPPARVFGSMFRTPSPPLLTSYTKLHGLLHPPPEVTLIDPLQDATDPDAGRRHLPRLYRMLPPDSRPVLKRPRPAVPHYPATPQLLQSLEAQLAAAEANLVAMRESHRLIDQHVGRTGRIVEWMDGQLLSSALELQGIELPGSPPED